MSLNILFLDDETMLGEIFYELFESAEIKIQIFTEAQLAIDAAQQNHFDLIFLDYRLPSTTGDEVAFKMPKEIPKYLLTGELELDCKYPFKAILSKPYKIPLIQEIIQQHLS